MRTDLPDLQSGSQINSDLQSFLYRRIINPFYLGSGLKIPNSEAQRVRPWDVVKDCETIDTSPAIAKTSAERSLTMSTIY